MPNLVIGGGTCGVRAAASIGADATLLERDSQPGGWERSTLPEDVGWVRGDVDVRLAVEGVYGGAPSLDSASMGRSLSVKGRLVELPLSPVSVKDVLPRGRHLQILRDQARSRARIVVQRFLGGGFEQRSYRDWVVQHFGELTFEALHEPYARARWGKPEALNASIARMHHVDCQGGAGFGLGETPSLGWAHMVGRVGRIETDVEIRGIELRDGAVSRVLTAEGALDVDGWLLCAASAAEVLAWLGDVVDGRLRFDATRLPHRHRIQVLLEAYQGAGATAHLPSEVHIVDADLPMFRVTRPSLLGGGTGLSAGALVAHLSVGANHRFWQLDDREICAAVAGAFPTVGLPAVDPETGFVQRMRLYDPGWVGTWHPVQSRIASLLGELGIRLVGRTGTHRWIDAGAELLHSQASQQQEAPDWELLRTLCDPPVWPDDADARLDPFVTG